MEEQTFLQWLLDFITSIETLIAVVIGGGIGLVTNLVLFKKEMQQKKKDFKREKLEELYKLLSDIAFKENDTLNMVINNLKFNKLDKGDLEVRRLKEYSEAVMIIDLYFPELHKHTRKLHEKRVQVRMCVHELKSVYSNSLEKGETYSVINEDDEKFQKYLEALRNVKEVVHDIQEEITDMAGEYR